MGVRLATPAPLRRLVHTNWLRHLLLGLSLVVVMLSIVGMHQLSVGHDVATGEQHGAHERQGQRRARRYAKQRTKRDETTLLDADPARHRRRQGPLR